MNRYIEDELMLKALKSQEGMTIVELLATLTMAIIILSSLVFVFATGLNLYAKANDTFNAHTMALFTQQRIEAEVLYANSMQIDGIEPLAFASNNSECLYVSNGRLADAVPNGAGGLKNQYVYLSGAYSGLSCLITYKLVSANNVLDVTISVYKGSVTNVLYTTQTDIVINNLIDTTKQCIALGNGVSGAGGAAVEFSNPS